MPETQELDCPKCGALSDKYDRPWKSIEAVRGHMGKCNGVPGIRNAIQNAQAAAGEVQTPSVELGAAQAGSEPAQGSSEAAQEHNKQLASSAQWAPGGARKVGSSSRAPAQAAAFVRPALSLQTVPQEYRAYISTLEQHIEELKGELKKLAKIDGNHLGHIERRLAQAEAALNMEPLLWMIMGAAGGAGLYFGVAKGTPVGAGGIIPWLAGGGIAGLVFNWLYHEIFGSTPAAMSGTSPKGSGLPSMHSVQNKVISKATDWAIGYGFRALTG